MAGAWYYESTKETAAGISMTKPTHRMILTTSIGALLALVGPLVEAGTLVDQARQAMAKAGRYWATQVASHGGYVWEYSTDLVTRRRGESGDLPPSTCWVQPPGTPAVGQALLGAYEATGMQLYLDAAVAAAHCLAWGQLQSGGWTYHIEFDRQRNRYRYHHLDPQTTPGYDRLDNTSTFDDDTTQSVTRFLMAVDQYVDDPRIDAALDRAFACFLAAQYRGGVWDGAWPQQYPLPATGYGRLPTYNDNTMSDCVRTMLAAYQQYGQRDHLDAVQRCLEFYLRSQLPAPQAGWAQQYDKEPAPRATAATAAVEAAASAAPGPTDETLKPAPARKFEPAAVTAGESSGNLQLLMDMYVEFGDPRYLDAVGRAIDWYRRARIGGTPEHGIWARFYELGTNRPLYFTRTYQLVYTDDDLPVHYSFQGNFGVDEQIRRYEEIRERGRE
ncbi:MAG: hypothetical protein A2W31_07840, partial [Planctomycetes bacterium RBG_16_64_10]